MDDKRGTLNCSEPWKFWHSLVVLVNNGVRIDQLFPRLELLWIILTVAIFGGGLFCGLACCGTGLVVTDRRDGSYQRDRIVNSAVQRRIRTADKENKRRANRVDSQLSLNQKKGPQGPRYRNGPIFKFFSPARLRLRNKSEIHLFPHLLASRLTKASDSGRTDGFLKDAP
jgi:hypothetical protein